MSDASAFGFGKFVPGFDFLKNMSGNAAAAAPAHSSWVAPTLDPAELDAARAAKNFATADALRAALQAASPSLARLPLPLDDPEYCALKSSHRPCSSIQVTYRALIA